MKQIIASVLAITGISVGLGSQELQLSQGMVVLGHIVVQSVEIWDLEIPGFDADQTKTRAWLFMPRSISKMPVTIYGHMYGNGVDRDQFFAEALTMAKDGTACFLIGGLVPWVKSWEAKAGDQKLLSEQLDLMNRHLAFIKSQDWVDEQRIVFVGHDYHAMFGALLAQADSGFCAYVLMAPSARWSDWKNYFGTSMDKDSYDGLFGEQQVIKAIAGPNKRPVLVQFGNDDHYVSAAMRKEFMAKKAKGTIIQTLNATHDNIDEVGKTERLKFMKQYLID